MNPESREEDRPSGRRGPFTAKAWRASKPLQFHPDPTSKTNIPSGPFRQWRIASRCAALCSRWLFWSARLERLNLRSLTVTRSAAHRSAVSNSETLTRHQNAASHLSGVLGIPKMRCALYVLFRGSFARGTYSINLETALRSSVC